MRKNGMTCRLLAACLWALPIGCGPVDDGSFEAENGEFFQDNAPDDEGESLGSAEQALTTVNFSTYLGSSRDDMASGVAVDNAGNVYVVGVTNSFNDGSNNDIFIGKLNSAGGFVYFVTVGGTGDETADGITVDALGNVYFVGTSTSYSASRDVIVGKLNPAASALVYLTYFGGSDIELARGIAVDPAGNAYVTGRTQSLNFPTSTSAPQKTLRGNTDAFVTKLNAAGTSLVYSTYLGGNEHEEGSGIAVDAYGYAYVTGTTSSTNFPTTAGAFQTAAIGKQDAFVTELVPAGSSFFYSTYLGGSDADFGQEIAIDASFNAYVTGYSYSTNFPATPGAFRTFNNGQQDAFVTKFTASGNAVYYSTYVGGGANDLAQSIAVGSTGKAYVTGVTNSTNFPTTANAFKPAISGNEDAFVIELNPGGSALNYSTFAGGSQTDVATDIAVNTAGNAHIAGYTTSTNFPTAFAMQSTPGGGMHESFVMKVNGP